MYPVSDALAASEVNSNTPQIDAHRRGNHCRNPFQRDFSFATCTDRPVRVLACVFACVPTENSRRIRVRRNAGRNKPWLRNGERSKIVWPILRCGDNAVGVYWGWKPPCIICGHGVVAWCERKKDAVSGGSGMFGFSLRMRCSYRFNFRIIPNPLGHSNIVQKLK